MTKKLFLAACIAAMAFTGCKKDPQPEPTPEPQTVSRLASMVHKSVVPSGLELSAVSRYTWENGKLVKVFDSLTSPFSSPVVTTQNLIYENGNHVRTEEESGVWTHYFTYEDGLLKSFCDIYANDTTIVGEVNGYNADGTVKEVTYTTASTNKFCFTWENDDVVKLENCTILPVEEADTTIHIVSYDGKPNAFTGVPLSTCLIGRDVAFVLNRLSKHNVFDASYTYNYDEKDRLISKVKENDSTFYYYIEQTIE